MLHISFYRSRCLAMDGRSDSDIPTFGYTGIILLHARVMFPCCFFFGKLSHWFFAQRNLPH
jgi:hypothetical protein